jgi:hypothetical protein
MFGLSLPQEIKEKAYGEPHHYWGARAILNRRSKFQIDLLPDRQVFSPEGVDWKNNRLISWVNREVIPWLNSESLEDGKLYLKEERLFHAAARPGGGYVYIGAWSFQSEKNQYDLLEPTPEAIWSGKSPIPKIGEQVKINFNQFGTGKVVDYFVETGEKQDGTKVKYQGVRVVLDVQPDWHKKQAPGQPWAMVFGIELA